MSGRPNSRQTKITDFGSSATNSKSTVTKDRPEDIKRKRKSEETLSEDNFQTQKSFRTSSYQSTMSTTSQSFGNFQGKEVESDDETTEKHGIKDPRTSYCQENDEYESDENDKKPAAGDRDYFEGDEETAAESDLNLSPDSHEACAEYTDQQANENAEDEIDKNDKKSREAKPAVDRDYFAGDEEDDKEAIDDSLYETTSGSETDAGTPVNELPRVSSSNLRKLPRLTSSKTHFVLSEKHGNGFVWDKGYVRMPCDRRNEMVIFNNEDKNTANRWRIIKKTYECKIRDVFQLEDAILKYNGHRKHMWDFQCLKSYFLESRFSEEKKSFFDRVLPKIIHCALGLEVLFKESIPLLQKNEDCMITMTQQQAACLLANAFLCTFPWRNKEKRQSIGLPTINFNSLFNSPTTENRLEKIKCILHYFERVTENTDKEDTRRKVPTGRITFRRQLLCDSEFPDWERTKKKFTQLHVSSEGTIEDDGAGMLQVDFANKFVGGGVIGHGCVQEEIRFMICPEMIVSRVITEVLEDNEVLIMTGCERFSNYAGYGNTFKWTGNHEDIVERDGWDRKYTEVVAMDATYFSVKEKNHQFSTDKVDRELNKAYCAFLCKDVEQEKLPAVCTGNWGCGAFRGNKELKALIQLIAASEAGRDVLFLTFHDTEFVSTLNDVHSRIKDCSFNTGDVVKMLRDFNRKKQYYSSSLFTALKNLL